MATRMGYEAVEALLQGKGNRLICVQNGQLTDVEIQDGLSMKKTINEEEYSVLQAMTCG